MKWMGDPRWSFVQMFMGVLVALITVVPPQWQFYYVIFCLSLMMFFICIIFAAHLRSKESNLSEKHNSLQVEFQKENSTRGVVNRDVKVDSVQKDEDLVEGGSMLLLYLLFCVLVFYFNSEVSILSLASLVNIHLVFIISSVGLIEINSLGERKKYSSIFIMFMRIAILFFSVCISGFIIMIVSGHDFVSLLISSIVLLWVGINSISIISKIIANIFHFLKLTKKIRK